MGLLLMELGRYEEARHSLEQGLSTLVNALGPDHEFVANLKLNLGELQRRLGEYDAALVTLNDAKRNLEDKVSREHWSICEVHHKLALVLEALENDSEADTHYRRAVRCRKEEQPGSSDHAQALEDYADFLRRRAEKQRGEGQTSQAIDIEQRATAMEQRAKALREKLKQVGAL